MVETQPYLSFDKVVVLFHLVLNSVLNMVMVLPTLSVVEISFDKAHAKMAMGPAHVILHAIILNHVQIIRVPCSSDGGHCC